MSGHDIETPAQALAALRWHAQSITPGSARAITAEGVAVIGRCADVLEAALKVPPTQEVMEAMVREEEARMDRLYPGPGMWDCDTDCQYIDELRTRAEKAEADLAKLRPVYEAAVQCKNDCKVSFDPNVHPCRSCGGLRACAAVEAWKEGK